MYSERSIRHNGPNFRMKLLKFLQKLELSFSTNSEKFNDFTQHVYSSEMSFMLMEGIIDLFVLRDLESYRGLVINITPDIIKTHSRKCKFLNSYLHSMSINILLLHFTRVMFYLHLSYVMFPSCQI